MIPEFPRFKHLEITDQDEIESCVRRFPPYSDFNFTSLFCYDVGGQFQASTLHGNLVVKMLDYMTAKPFYTFLGREKVDETICKLLELSVGEGLSPMLKLVPECCVQGETIAHSNFVFTEDPDSFDYICCVEKLAELAGGDFQRKRKRIAKFEQDHPTHAVVPINLSDCHTRERILKLLCRWQHQKRKSDDDVAVEFGAIRRCLEYARHFNLMSHGLMVAGEIVGFAIFEPLQGGYLQGHFLKTDPVYLHSCDFLLAEMMKIGRAKGLTLFNFEQDLGLPGLRRSKTSWRPTAYLRKYAITKGGIA